MAIINLTFSIIVAALCSIVSASSVDSDAANNLRADNKTISFGVKCFLLQDWNAYDLKGLSRHVKSQV